MKSPLFDISFEKLPTDPGERHEVLVDLFGQYLFWVHGQTISRTRRLVESEQERSELGNLYRSVFDEIANLSEKERDAAVRLAEAAIGSFAGSLLTMISGQGFEDSIGSNHVFRYRLDMEVCDAESGEVVFEETINRGGKSSFRSTGEGG